MADKVSPSQIMSKRIGREWMVLRFRGCSANWMPLSVRIVWTLQGTASSMCCRNAHAVFLSAFSTSRVTANLLVRSMPTRRWSLS